MLEISGINTYYGKSHILHNLSLRIDSGEVVALVGKNGVGKTTSLRSIMGIAPPKTGVVIFRGEEIQALKPYQIAQRKISFIPEERRIFPNLTVRENLVLGLLASGFRNSKERRIKEIFEYFPRLKERENHFGRNLSGGEQQMLAIGRGLIAGPELMLIDEPTEGLMPIMVEKISQVLKDINRNGVTILIVERKLPLLLEISTRAYILLKGKVMAEGRSSEILRDEDALKYLTV